jgi:hypothetical protein
MNPGVYPGVYREIANTKGCCSAKVLITDHRASLKEESIEANECLRQWEIQGALAATVKDSDGSPSLCP